MQQDNFIYDENGVYDSLWFDINWIHRITKTKYNEKWYDRDGFDKKWYDRNWFDRDWIHKETWTKYNKEWYNMWWLDEDWYDENWVWRNWPDWRSIWDVAIQSDTEE